VCMLLLCAALLTVALLQIMTLVEAAHVVPATPPTPLHSSISPTGPPTLPAALPAAAQSADCTPLGTLPTPAPLPMTSPGLQQLIDTPDVYNVHGASVDDISAQLRRCAPSSSEGTFSGATSYWLGTHYSYQLTSHGTCRLADITVAVHISQVLPSWQDNGSDALTDQWSAYERSLVLHENGHVVIIISQAHMLLDDLSALSDLPCETIAASASNIIAANIGTLESANSEYDTTTNHGATQGAIW